MSIPLDALLSRLERVLQRGEGYRARCPSHGSRGLTLSVKQAEDGRILLHCFAGCSAHEICGAMGLDVRDLMPDLKPGEKPPPRPPERVYACGCVTDCQGRVKTFCAEGKRLRDVFLMAMWWATPADKKYFSHWFDTPEARAFDGGGRPGEGYFKDGPISGPRGRWP